MCASAGWVTEGEGAFSEMSGSPPRNIHQEALRGIAKVGTAWKLRHSDAADLLGVGDKSNNTATAPAEPAALPGVH